MHVLIERAPTCTCRVGLSRLSRLPAKLRCLLVLASVFAASPAFAHGVAQGDKGYIQEIAGTHLVPFAYLGAEHAGLSLGKGVVGSPGEL
jgi:hypothetical protein